MKTTLLILTSEFPPQPGGIGNHAYQLAKRFSGHGFQVHVLCDQQSEGGEEERDFDARQPFSIHRIVRRRLIFLSYINRIRTAFTLAKRADLILASGKFSLWQAAGISRFLKRKYIAVLHGTELLLPNPLLRRLTDVSIKCFDEVIAVSQFTVSLTAHLHLKNTHIIPNGFETATFDKMPFQAKKLLQPNRPKLITIGNLTQRKGQHNVIRALPGLVKIFPQLEYHMVGIPTNRRSLEKLATDLHVSDSVFFHGRVDAITKHKLLTDSDVFIMLSEQTQTGDVEGFGIAILEANALGLPAIGSLGCGIEDAINDGFSGKLIPHNNPEALKTALTEILAHYTHYSKNSKKWSENFTWEKIINQYLKIVER